MSPCVSVEVQYVADVTNIGTLVSVTGRPNQTKGKLTPKST